MPVNQGTVAHGERPVQKAKKKLREKPDRLGGTFRMRKKSAKSRSAIGIGNAAAASKFMKDPDENDWVVMPDSCAMQFWDVLIFSALIWTAVVTPFEVAFMEYNFTSNPSLYCLNWIVNVAFMLDMVLQFFLPVCLEDGSITYKNAEIARYYLLGWFTPDLVSIIPFDQLGVKRGRSLRVVRLCRLVKLVRLLRSSRILNRWETSIALSRARRGRRRGDRTDSRKAQILGCPRLARIYVCPRGPGKRPTASSWRI